MVGQRLKISKFKNGARTMRELARFVSSNSDRRAKDRQTASKLHPIFARRDKTTIFSFSMISIIQSATIVLL
jgi:hypothetical protein